MNCNFRLENWFKNFGINSKKIEYQLSHEVIIQNIRNKFTSRRISFARKWINSGSGEWIRALKIIFFAQRLTEGDAWSLGAVTRRPRAREAELMAGRLPEMHISTNSTKWPASPRHVTSVPPSPLFCLGRFAIKAIVFFRVFTSNEVVQILRGNPHWTS